MDSEKNLEINILGFNNDDKGHENVVVVELKQWSQVRPAGKQYFVKRKDGRADFFPYCGKGWSGPF